MSEKRKMFYICSMCFRTSSEVEVCHGRPMLYCDAGCWGDECRKPLMAGDGQLITRAPRWWLQHRPVFTHIH